MRKSRHFIRKFPNHVPRIKPSDRVHLYEASSPIDKETGRPAMVLGAIVVEREGDRAEAIGTYYAGPMVTGMYVFALKKTDGQWMIESVKSPGLGSALRSGTGKGRVCRRAGGRDGSKRGKSLRAKSSDLDLEMVTPLPALAKRDPAVSST